MKVAFNARVLATNEIRGWSRYTQNLIVGLAELGVDIHLLSDREINIALLGKAAGKCRVHISPAPNYVLWEQVEQKSLCDQLKVDVLHCPVNYGLPFFGKFKKVLTLHDAIEKSFYDQGKSWKDKLKPEHLKIRTLHYLSQAGADRVITVSEHAKNDIVQSYGLSPEKIKVIYEAADSTFSSKQAVSLEELRKRHPRLPEKYIFYVGGLEKRKNIPLLLEAMESLKDIPHQLVIAGGDRALIEAYRHQVKDRGLNGRVILLGWVEDKDLPALYAYARCFVYPSFHEGFGLQVVEALSMGTPVLCSDNTSLAEILDDKESTFAPSDPAHLVKLIRQTVQDEAYYQKKKSQALERSRKFSWQETARQTLAVYKELVG